MNEIKKMQTPWDSDKILMADIGCYERGCVCVANQWDADYPSECVPMVEYKEWVGLTDEDIFGIFGTYRGDPDYNHDQLLLDARRIEVKIKGLNT